MRNSARTVCAVLFDLDGTLLDTAPDMVGALNELRHEERTEALSFDVVRPLVSLGATALVRLAFPDVDAVAFAALRTRFLKLYQSRLARETLPFEGVLDALARLDSNRIPWGIVTNKPGWLTEPLLRQLAPLDSARVIVSGDTLAERKPHPAPLLYAADKLGVAAARCIYIGDAERDVLAAQAAGMKAFVALFGYIPTDAQPRTWPAGGWLESPQAMIELLDSIISSRH